MFCFFSPEVSSWAVISAMELSYSTTKQKKKGRLKLELAYIPLSFRLTGDTATTISDEISLTMSYNHRDSDKDLCYERLVKLENCNIDFTAECPEQCFPECCLNISNKIRISSFFSAVSFSCLLFIMYIWSIRV